MAQISRQVTTLTVVFLIAGIFALVGGQVAEADDYVSMPSAKAEARHLKIRFVEYDGSTNGEMVVQVKNFGKTDATFVSEGLFFVPKGNPESAPQRLGAAGPFTQIAKKGPISHQEKLLVKAGEDAILRLDVFCIDSHRSSPGSSTKFKIANKKLPKQLRRELKAGNAAIMKAHKGDRQKAKSAIQSNMWETRDKKWIKIQGERKAEKSAPTPSPHRNQQRRIKPSRLKDAL